MYRARACTRPIDLPLSFSPAQVGQKTRRGGDNKKTATLTDPPPIPKGRFTRIWLRAISQEPLRIEFHRIGINSRVVQDLPV